MRPRLMRAARAPRAAAPAPPGRGPGAAREAHAALPARLQAHPGLQRLVPGAHAAERRARHRRHPRDPADVDRHRRRHRARGRHDHLRHRLPRHRLPDRRRLVRGRDGRSLADAWSGQPAGLPGHDRRRLPEPVHARRPEHRARATPRMVFMIEAQIALRARRTRPCAQRGPAPDRGAPGGAGSATTSGCSGGWRARSGPPAAARAGTSTPTGATPRCGPGHLGFRRKTRRFDPADYHVQAGYLQDRSGVSREGAVHGTIRG